MIRFNRWFSTQLFDRWRFTEYSGNPFGQVGYSANWWPPQPEYGRGIVEELLGA